MAYLSQLYRISSIRRIQRGTTNVVSPAEYQFWSSASTVLPSSVGVSTVSLTPVDTTKTVVSIKAGSTSTVRNSRVLAACSGGTSTVQTKPGGFDYVLESSKITFTTKQGYQGSTGWPQGECGPGYPPLIMEENIQWEIIEYN